MCVQSPAPVLGSLGLADMGLRFQEKSRGGSVVKLPVCTLNQVPVPAATTDTRCGAVSRVELAGVSQLQAALEISDL